MWTLPQDCHKGSLVEQEGTGKSLCRGYHEEGEHKEGTKAGGHQDLACSCGAVPRSEAISWGCPSTAAPRCGIGPFLGPISKVVDFWISGTVSIRQESEISHGIPGPLLPGVMPQDGQAPIPLAQACSSGQEYRLGVQPSLPFVRAADPG